MRVEKARQIGFCFGVRRAVDQVKLVAGERRGVVTLGPVVHNERVRQELAELGVREANSPKDIQGDTVVISTHGVTPQQEAELRSQYVNLVNTTCPFVHRAQIAARRLAKAGFFVVIYGDAGHAEVKGILGWAGGQGLATLEAKTVTGLKKLPRRLGVLSQTTQIPAHFTDFVKKLIDTTFTRDSELWVIDTICHDTRKRQTAALELASKVDLMLVIGSHTSANTNRLAELSAEVTETRLIETAEEIQPSWLEGKPCIGITTGASTADQTINEVLSKLSEYDLNQDLSGTKDQ